MNSIFKNLGADNKDFHLAPLVVGPVPIGYEPQYSRVYISPYPHIVFKREQEYFCRMLCQLSYSSINGGGSWN